MSNDKHRDKPSGKDSSSEKAKNSGSQVNLDKGRDGRLNENKQAQQIATPPIKTKPKDK